MLIKICFRQVLRIKSWYKRGQEKSVCEEVEAKMRFVPRGGVRVKESYGGAGGGGDAAALVKTGEKTVCFNENDPEDGEENQFS